MKLKQQVSSTIASLLIYMKFIEVTLKVDIRQYNKH